MNGLTRSVLNFLVPVLTLAVSAPAFAVVTLRAYPTYFRTAITDATTGELSVFTGKVQQSATMGTPQECSANNTFFNVNAPCDSCSKAARAARPLGSEACNSAEIHRNLPFSITLRSNDAADYPNCSNIIVARVAGGTTVIAGTQQTTFTPGVAEQDVTTNFTWSQICTAAGGDANCATSFNKRIEFGFDRACNQTDLGSTGVFMKIQHRFVQNNPAMTLACNDTGNTAQPFEGICDYIVSPGDEKIFITNTRGVTDQGFKVADLKSGNGETEDGSGMVYSQFRVYFRPTAEGAPDSMTYSDSFSDLLIEGTGLKEPRVNGLVNGTQYAFWGAMVDQGGNVTYFPSLAALKSTANQIGTPEKVFGLLDEKGCFIATAAYGTPQAHEIQVLRDFRNTYLARSEMGRDLIRLYYQYSPQAAAYIADSELLRAAVRVVLSPIIVGAQWALDNAALLNFSSAQDAAEATSQTQEEVSGETE